MAVETYLHNFAIRKLLSLYLEHISYKTAIVHFIDNFEWSEFLKIHHSQKFNAVLQYFRLKLFWSVCPVYKPFKELTIEGIDQIFLSDSLT